jgi:hypothetical protein
MAMTADVYLKFDPEVARLVRTQDRVRIENPADSVATDLTTSAGNSTAPDGRLGRSEPPDASSDSPLPAGATMRTPGLEPGWVAPPAPKGDFSALSEGVESASVARIDRQWHEKAPGVRPFRRHPSNGSGGFLPQNYRRHFSRNSPRQDGGAGTPAGASRKVLC